jgi:Uma2 family endonuclease
MTAATAEPPAADRPDAPHETFADIARRLGDIPPERIIWLPRPATEADVLRAAAGEPKRLTELIDGILVEKAMGQCEGFLAASLIAFLMAHVRANRLGVVGAPGTILRLKPGQNRLPDVSFTAWASLPTADAHLQRVGAYAPDLAVEVVSEGNTRAELARKRAEYFAAGTKLVWEIDPDARTVAVYTGPTAHTLLTAADALDGGAVLPGFALPLADLFDDPQLNPRA